MNAGTNRYPILQLMGLIHTQSCKLFVVFVWGFKFTNGQLDRKTFEVDKWASLELPTRQ